MDEQTTKNLIEETDRLLQDESTDWQVIEALWRPYVDQGNTEAQFRLASAYLDYGFDEGPEKEHEMRALLRIAADKDHPDATYRLSYSYEEGAEQDALILKAGELGSIEAQYSLGASYATGDWTGPKDLVLATEWYRRAAERGHPEAQYNLGFMYILGQGVSADTQVGLRWLHLSADQGDGSAFRLLADLYRYGYYNVPIDKKEGDYWDEKYRIDNPEHWAKDQAARKKSNPKIQLSDSAVSPFRADHQ